MTRYEIIEQCLMVMHKRFNKKCNIDNSDVFVWSKDLSQVPDHKLSDAFNDAYRLINKERMPMSREVLEVFLQGNSMRNRTLSDCDRCDEGLIGCYTPSPDKRFFYRVSYACDCEWGDKRKQQGVASSPPRDSVDHNTYHAWEKEKIKGAIPGWHSDCMPSTREIVEMIKNKLGHC